MEAEATTVRPSLAAAAADLAQGGSEKQKMGKRVRGCRFLGVFLRREAVFGEE